MSDLNKFRKNVTIYRKRKYNAAGKRYTQENLAATIGLSADELGHRLHGNGRSLLTNENILAIVIALARWETLTWEEAVDLLSSMGYPLDRPYWKTELQRFLSPPSISGLVPSVVEAGGEDGEERLLSPANKPLLSPTKLQQFRLFQVSSYVGNNREYAEYLGWECVTYETHHKNSVLTTKR